MNSIADRGDEVIYKYTLEFKKDLDKIFYGNQFLMKSFPRFYKKVGSMRNDIKYSILKFYYDNQAIVQIFKPREEYDYSSVPILCYAPFEKVYIDTMYISFNKSTLGIINIIDLFSKFAFSKLFILSENASNLSSDKAVEAFKEFNKNYPIKNIYTDDGREYLGNFKNYMIELGINQIPSGANNKTAMSPIERFNKTLRLSIEKYRVLYGKITNKVIKVITDSYNSNEHSNLKYSPNEILESKEKQKEIQKYYLSRKKDYLNSDEVIDGWVRVLISYGTFSKVKPVWSLKLYKIDFYDPIKHRYKLEGSKDYYSRSQLLSVNKKYLMNENLKFDDVVVEKRVLRSTDKGGVRTRGIKK